MPTGKWIRNSQPPHLRHLGWDETPAEFSRAKTDASIKPKLSGSFVHRSVRERERASNNKRYPRSGDRPRGDRGEVGDDFPAFEAGDAEVDYVFGIASGGGEEGGAGGEFERFPQRDGAERPCQVQGAEASDGGGSGSAGGGIQQAQSGGEGGLAGGGEFFEGGRGLGDLLIADQRGSRRGRPVARRVINDGGAGGLAWAGRSGGDQSQGVVFCQRIKSLQAGSSFFRDDGEHFSARDLDFPQGEAEFVRLADDGRLHD